MRTALRRILRLERSQTFVVPTNFSTLRINLEGGVSNASAKTHRVSIDGGVFFPVQARRCRSDGARIGRTALPVKVRPSP